MSSSNILRAELGDEAETHRAELEELKHLLGITHSHFDCWLYSFLENKHFDIPQTMDKLHRRAVMEAEELATHEITPALFDGLSRGIIQITGCDKRGRLCLYVTSSRDFPVAANRESNKRAFDMILSYATRLRPSHKSCRCVLLVDQSGARVGANMDFLLQAAVALRVSKFFPGLVERIFIVRASRVLAAVLRPVVRRLPRALADRVVVVADAELRAGALRQWFDAEALPAALGGTKSQGEMEKGNGEREGEGENGEREGEGGDGDGDGPREWRRFAEDVTAHFRALQDAVARRGIGVKEWELEELEREEKEKKREEEERGEEREKEKEEKKEEGKVEKGRGKIENWPARRRFCETVKETARREKCAGAAAAFLRCALFVCGAVAAFCLPAWHREEVASGVSSRDGWQIGLFFVFGFLSAI